MNFPELCSPTAHASLALLAATDLSTQSGVLPDGVGVGTGDQAVPFQFSATGAALAVAGPPTTLNVRLLPDGRLAAKAYGRPAAAAAPTFRSPCLTDPNWRP